MVGGGERRDASTVSLLAEQVVVNCPPSALEALFRHRPADWLAPFLRLAGDAGEAAGHSLMGDARAPATGERSHTLQLGEPHRSGGQLLIDLQWETAEYRTLFRSFAGELRIRQVDGCAVLSIEGAFDPVPDLLGSTSGPAAARRAAEFAVRSLLAQLRAALECQEQTARE